MAIHLQELGRKYGVAFRVSREHAPLSAGVRVVGLTVELTGSHERGEGGPGESAPPPSGMRVAVCEECRRVADALRRIAHGATPVGWQGITFDVREVAPVTSPAPDLGHRPRVTVAITVTHGGEARPMDTLVTHGFDEVVARLEAMGITERTRGRGARPTPVTPKMALGRRGRRSARAISPRPARPGSRRRSTRRS